MNLSRQQLAEALKITSPVIGNRRNIPILSSVILSASNGNAELQATDIDVGIRLQLDAQGDLPPVALDHKSLKGLVRSLPKAIKNITIDVPAPESGEAFVNGVKMLTLLADNFPVDVGTQVDGPSCEIPDLSNLLKDLLPFVSHDESRFALNGVFLNFRDGELSATDGHRLAVLRTPARGEIDSVILPRGAVEILAQLSIGSLTTKHDRENGQLSAKVMGKHVFGVVTTRLVEGQFPNYHQVVPELETLTTHLTVDVEAFKVFLKMTIGIASERSSPLAIELLDGQVLASVRGDTSSFDRTAIPAATYTGPDVYITFNARYLADAMEFVSSSTATFSLKDGLCPGAFYQEDGVAVIMPMRGDEHKDWAKNGLRKTEEIHVQETEEEVAA